MRAAAKTSAWRSKNLSTRLRSGSFDSIAVAAGALVLRALDIRLHLNKYECRIDSQPCKLLVNPSGHPAYGHRRLLSLYGTQDFYGKQIELRLGLGPMDHAGRIPHARSPVRRCY